MRVLIVDDQRSIRMVSASVVSALGHEVLEASSGQEAISICTEEKIDLILMDVEMPGLNGFETTKKNQRSESDLVSHYFRQRQNRSKILF